VLIGYRAKANAVEHEQKADVSKGNGFFAICRARLIAINAETNVGNVEQRASSGRAAGLSAEQNIFFAHRVATLNTGVFKTKC
tara:strand:+ start:247 stop:495 length:249 start_codon:yes stop_codon:yes gene_type:complete